MLDLASLFIGSALAQTAAGDASPPGGSGTSMYMNLLPLVLVLAVFYILIIRPQQKKLDEQQRMIAALQRGDKVVTSGGIYGKISKIEGNDILILEIADGVNIKVGRAHVSGLDKPQPAAEIEKKK